MQMVKKLENNMSKKTIKVYIQKMIKPFREWRTAQRRKAYAANNDNNTGSKGIGKCNGKSSGKGTSDNAAAPGAALHTEGGGKGNVTSTDINNKYNIASKGKSKGKGSADAFFSRPMDRSQCTHYAGFS